MWYNVNNNVVISFAACGTTYETIYAGFLYTIFRGHQKYSGRDVYFW